MAMDAAGVQAMANAFRRQARNVQYPDYKPKEDFSLWLAGYKEKVKNAFGYTAAQVDELKEEVVRSISGKLQSGTALDAYNRLPAATQGDFTLLSEALIEEFIDPQEKTRFLEDFSFNKRQKGQSLKDFMQLILKDQGRYSRMRDTIGVGAAAVPNQEKIRDGIRRFKKGIRNREGKVDKDQTRHLRYNLLKEEDLNWTTALDIASRWEAANDYDDEKPSSSSEDDDEESVDAVECEKKKKKSKAARTEKVVINAVEGGAIAAMIDKVETNARDIKGVKSEQERLTANVTSWKNETSDTLSQILASVTRTERNQGPGQGQGQGQNTAGQSFNRNYQRPNSFTWKGRVGQNQQSGFRFNRNSPQNFRSPATASATTTAAGSATTPAATAPAAAPAVTAAAALEMEPEAQSLGAEGGASVTIPMDQFLELYNRAGEDVCDDDFMAAVADLNFQ